MLKSAVMMAKSLMLALWLALATRDYSECKDLIQQGVYPDARDEMGRSPLYRTAQSPKLDKFARMLLKAGAAVNGTTVLGETALFAAARYGNESGLRLLLKHGAAPNIRNRKGSTVLMVAAEEGNLGPVQALLAAGAEVNACDGHGETALMAAAAMGNEAVVRVLLASGADRWISTPYGWNALMFANEWKQPKIADILQIHPKFSDNAASVTAATTLDHQRLVAQEELDTVDLGGDSFSDAYGLESTLEVKGPINFAESMPLFPRLGKGLQGHCQVDHPQPWGAGDFRSCVSYRSGRPQVIHTSDGRVWQAVEATKHYKGLTSNFRAFAPRIKTGDIPLDRHPDGIVVRRIDNTKIPGVAYANAFDKKTSQEMGDWPGEGRILPRCDPCGNACLDRAVNTLLQLILKPRVDIYSPSVQAVSTLIFDACYSRREPSASHLKQGVDPDAKTRKRLSGLRVGKANVYDSFVKKLLAHKAKSGRRPSAK